MPFLRAPAPPESSSSVPAIRRARARRMVPVSTPPMQKRVQQALLMVFVQDVWILIVCSVLAWRLHDVVDNLFSTSGGFETEFPAEGPWVILLWSMLLVTVGAYSYRNFGSGFEEYRAIAMASVISVGLVGFFGFLTQSMMSRGYPLLLFVLALGALILARYADRKILHFFRRQGRLMHRTVAIGAPDAVAELVRVLEREPWTGYRVVGMCVPASQVAEVPAGGVPVLGTVDDVREVALEQRADTLLVAGGSYSSSADLRRLGWEVEGLRLDLLVIPSLTDVAGPRIHMRHVAGLPLVHVEEPQGDRAGGVGKRLFDMLLAGVMLVLLSPMVLVVAAIIKAQDGGSVFYRQRRVGIMGKDFMMVKFRSMVPNADQVVAELKAANESQGGVLFKIKHDPRITRFGRVMRKFSIDEIPQLINVVKGEMSLVGPRPPLPSEVAEYDDVVHRRLLVRPGMTGLWQVSGRSDLTWDESVRLDLYYVDNWSLVFDLVIMVKTVKAVLFSDGAY